MARLVTLVVPLLVMFAACEKKNPNYCPTPGMNGCAPDASGSSRPTCSASPDCKTAELPVCDTTTEGGQCVACTQAERGACGGMTPRCEHNSCVACVDDGHCLGSVCLLNGACADAATVVHAVAMNGLSVPGCGLPGGAGPCTLEQALTNARDKTQTVIKLDDAAVYAPVSNNFRVEPNADVILHLRVGATLTRRDTSDGAVITVNGNNSGKLTLLGGTIRGGHSGGSNPGDGIACTMGGTLVMDGTRITANEAAAINTSNCAVTITRTQLDNNNQTGTLTAAIRISGGSATLARSTIHDNRGGGLDVGSNAKFTVVGNVFVGNGASSGNVGGISINTNASSNRLEFNSIVENKSQALAAAGLSCAADSDFVAANNIIWNNNSNLTTTSIQLSGSCRQRYSDIGPTALPNALDAGNNKNTNPMFVNATSDLHLTAASQLGDLAADPQANIMGVASLDIDGDPRTAPATMGADQPRAN